MSNNDKKINEAVEHGAYMRKAGYRAGYTDALYNLTKAICSPECTTLQDALIIATKMTNKADEVIKDYK